MSGFALHPNPLPMNLRLSLIAHVKVIVGRFMGRGDFCAPCPSRTFHGRVTVLPFPSGVVGIDESSQQIR